MDHNGRPHHNWVMAGRYLAGQRRAAVGRHEPLARDRQRSMVSTDFEWLHGVDGRHQ
jgi:hypothetical protein